MTVVHCDKDEVEEGGDGEWRVGCCRMLVKDLGLALTLTSVADTDEQFDRAKEIYGVKGGVQ